MIYTEEEKKEMWERDQVYFAERAHEFPCCEIPTLSLCLKCDLNYCVNLRELIRLKLI